MWLKGKNIDLVLKNAKKLYILKIKNYNIVEDGFYSCITPFKDAEKKYYEFIEINNKKMDK